MMGDAAGSDADGSYGEDGETKDDYDDFKKWLDKQDSSKPEAPPQEPAAPKAPVAPKLDVAWVCNICKGNAKECDLSQLLSIHAHTTCTKIIIKSSCSYAVSFLRWKAKNQGILDGKIRPTNAKRRPPQHPRVSQGDCKESIAALRRRIAEKKAQLEFLGWYWLHVSASCHVEINHIISVYTHYGLYFGICWVKFFQQLDPTYPKT